MNRWERYKTMSKDDWGSRKPQRRPAAGPGCPEGRQMVFGLECALKVELSPCAGDADMRNERGLAQLLLAFCLSNWKWGVLYQDKDWRQSCHSGKSNVLLWGPNSHSSLLRCQVSKVPHHFFLL